MGILKDYSNRPRIKIPYDPLDLIIELLGLSALLLLVIMPVFQYGKLPDSIPTHFGPDGIPDSYGNKSTIWLLPAIGAGMYLMMVIINRFPHIFNYAVKITPENAAKQYRFATRLIRTLNTIITSLFCYLNYSIIKTSMGEAGGLGKWMLPVVLVVIFGTTGYYLLRSFQERK